MPERAVLAIFSISLFFNSALTTLDLSGNGLEGEGGKAIAEVLPKW